MAITTVAQYLTAPKQIVRFTKTAAVTATAGAPYNLFDRPGDPGAGSYSDYGTAPYTVPVAGNAGYPKISPFPSGVQGWLTGVRFSCTVPCRLQLFDALQAAGPLTSAASYPSMSADGPSFDDRLPPNGVPVWLDSYIGLQLWYEAGTSGRSGAVPTIGYFGAPLTTEAVAVMSSATLAARQMLQLGLQSGDNGMLNIESQIAGASSTGGGGLRVLRPLWSGRVREAGGEYFNDYVATGMPEVFATTAFYLVVTPDGTSTGLPDVQIEIANG